MSGAEPASGRHLQISVAAIAIAAAALVVTGLATSRSVAAGPEAAPPSSSHSDLVIATIQPRHERLWQAEQDGNWQFAAYELGNLHGTWSIASNTRSPFRI
jgi:hypothetical protein